MVFGELHRPRSRQVGYAGTRHDGARPLLDQRRCSGHVLGRRLPDRRGVSRPGFPLQRGCLSPNAARRALSGHQPRAGHGDIWPDSDRHRHRYLGNAASAFADASAAALARLLNYASDCPLRVVRRADAAAIRRSHPHDPDADVHCGLAAMPTRARLRPPEAGPAAQSQLLDLSLVTKPSVLFA